MEIRVTWKEVVQGSFSQFVDPFIALRASIYFPGLEPLPRAFFEADRCRVTRLVEFDLVLVLRRRANARNVSFSNSLRRLIYLYQLQVDNQLVV